MNMKENALTTNPMVMVNVFLITMPQWVGHMKVNGTMVTFVEKENSHTRMAILTKDNGRITNALAMAHIIIKTARFTMENGKTICKMDRERRYGPTARCIRVPTWTAVSRASAHTHGPMGPSTLATGSTTK